MLTKHKFPADVEALFIQINFRNWKGLLCELYHPSSQSDQYLFDNLDKTLDVYSTSEKILTSRDFNAQEGETCFDRFLYQHELKSLNKDDTCYRKPNNLSCIDFLLTNSLCSFIARGTEQYFSKCNKNSKY